EGALVVKEHQTGKIIAAISGRDYQIGELNRVMVNRQPGSVFKPLSVYGPALMTSSYEPYSVLPDQRIEGADYPVHNADGQYVGIISLYEAITQSKNTSAVWLLDKIGIDHAKEYLSNMGITIPDDGLAIGLGGLEEGVSPLQMVDAYSAFANQGVIIDSVAISELYSRDHKLLFQEESKKTKIFTPQVAWDMTEILLSTVQIDTEQAGEYANDLARTTRTTQPPFTKRNNVETEFVSYTLQSMSAVWMGYDDTDEDHDCTGGSEHPARLTYNLLTKWCEPKSLVCELSQPVGVERAP